MADEKAIEAMASVMYDHASFFVKTAWHELEPVEKVVYRNAATAALAAYRRYQAEAGIVEVDYVPTVLSLPDADLTQIVLADVPTYAAETVNATILRKMDDRTIIGVQWPAAQEREG